jgi:hypothetical protein
MTYTPADRSTVAKLNASLVIEQDALLRDGLTGSAKAIGDYLAAASFDSRLRLANLIKNVEWAA